jgi:hypothetical protein
MTKPMYVGQLPFDIYYRYALILTGPLRVHGKAKEKNPYPQHGTYILQALFCKVRLVTSLVRYVQFAS